MAHRETEAESLRRQWKQVMLDHDLPEDHDTAVRMHRVCKWLSESQCLYREGRTDLAFIAGWISWNALYARWDAEGQSERDFASMRTCLGELLSVDQEGFLEAWVYRDRRSIAAVLDNPFLSRHFWREIGSRNADVELSRHVEPDMADRLIRQSRWARLLEELFGRLYVLRNQLIHGGATPNSRVNREQVASGQIIEGFMVAALRAIIHGDNPWHDWGPLPYPVLEID